MTRKSKSTNLMICISCKKIVKIKPLSRKAAKYEGFELLCPFCGAKLQPYTQTQDDTEDTVENQTELTQFLDKNEREIC
ncbi:MAG: hypothetical protein DRH06_00415 [Deltaproteobacteria bacterium]|nr:MAG: hypothetical protein DRH06_00415 [Deltaproteobacteria bacterium]